MTMPQGKWNLTHDPMAASAFAAPKERAENAANDLTAQGTAHGARSTFSHGISEIVAAAAAAALRCIQ